MTDRVPATDRRPGLICFSHLRWGFVYQRPQHLLVRALRDYRVTFIEEPIIEPRAEPHLRRSEPSEGLEVLSPIFPEGLAAAQALEHQRKLLDQHLAGVQHSIEVSWYYTPMALRFSHHVHFPIVVYDCMDELSQFKGAPRELLALEQLLLSRAALVLTGGLSLYEVKRNLHPNVHAFPSSVDTAHYRPSRDRQAQVAPDDLAAIAGPRIGYFGVIDERIDLALVDGVARARPDVQIVMIGPVVKIDPATLPRAENIHWLGMKSYAELPRYLAGLDVGWMPFALNDATRFISPTKTPEFLAAGVPVVSTSIVDVVRTWGAPGLVGIADDVPASIAALTAAMQLRQNKEWLGRVDQQLALSSWDQTWQQIRALIEACHPQGAATRPASAATEPALPQSRTGPGV